MSLGFRIAAALGIVVAASSGCNVVTMTERHLDRRFDRADLEVATSTTDAAHLTYRYGGATSERTPVLLLHGFGASAIWQWPDQVEALAPTRTVIVPDLLWFGGSRPTTADYRLDAQVAAMQALLDELAEHDIERVDVVGVSYGGLVAHELAVAEPERVRRLVMVDSPGRAFSMDEYRALCDRFGVESAAEFLIPEDEHGVQVLLDLAYDDPPRPPKWAKRQILAGLYTDHADEKAALIDTLVADIPDYASRPLPAPRPTLIVWGENDPVFPLAAGRRLAEMLDAELSVIANAKHAPNLEHPERFNATLIAFLDG